MATPTTAEIPSNPNSSCRLLVCLNSLPPHDQRVFRGLLDHIELVRLSACCRSLRSSIRNDQILWHELYHRDFLSGAHYDKEMEFVLWCTRTDVNNPCTSDKRADLLENVDWYNTYRRRVSTENNWRYGRRKTTHIDMERDEHGPIHNARAENDHMFITKQNPSDEISRHSYTLECLPHSNRRSNNSIVYKSTFSTSPNVLLLDSGNDYKFAPSDHYIAVYNRPFGCKTDYNVKILTRKHGGVFTTFYAPAPYEVRAIEGKWILFVCESKDILDDSLYVYDIVVFDIDNSIMCPGSTDGIWNARCLYKTTNDTAIVYTARLVKDDDVDRIEWALYEFSSNNPVVRLRSGWLQLPEIQTRSLGPAYNLSGSHIMLRLHSQVCRFPHVIHNVALGGQCNTPQNCYTISDNNIPVPLLQLGFKRQLSAKSPLQVWTDLSCNDDQILQSPGATSYRHIIGNLYLITNPTSHGSKLLVDINTKEIIRKLKPIGSGEKIMAYTMVGIICSPVYRDASIIQEYGEL